MAFEEVIGSPGEVFLKAQLWDSKVGNDERLSRSKVMSFITTYAAKIESVLQEMRIVVGGITFAMGSHESPSKSTQSASTSQPHDKAPQSKRKELVLVKQAGSRIQHQGGRM